MAPTSDLGAYAGTAALLGFVGYRFGAERRTALNTMRWLVYAFGLFEAGSLAILAPASVRLLTGVGVGEATVVGLGDALRTAAVSALVGVAYAVRPATPKRPARVWLVPALVVQLVTGLLFALARPRAAADGTLSVDVPGRWALVSHYLVFIGYTLSGLTMLALALLPQARHGGSRPLRFGVQLGIAAIVVGAAWTLWTLDDILSVARYGTQGGSDDSVSNLFGVCCVALLVTGGTVGRWGGALAAPQRWWGAYKRYRTLGPLWSALHHALPHIALEPGDRPRPGMAADIEFLAYRRAIEIHDAGLALRQYRQPGFAAWLAEAGIEAERYSAAELEAAALAVAVENLRRERRFEGGGPELGPAAGSGLDQRSGRDLDQRAPANLDRRARPDLGSGASAGTESGAESAWLVDVARAFHRSPLVGLAVRAC